MADSNTVERVASVSRTLHHGGNMIVLSKDKAVNVPVNSVQYLEGKDALHPEGHEAEGSAAATPTGQEKGPAVLRADGVQTGTEGPEIPDEDVDARASNGGFELTETGGGWYEISGPGLDQPEKVRGEEAARSRLAELVATGGPTDTPPPAA